MSDQEQGVVFPESAEGRRSTSAVGRAVVADALRPADPDALLTIGGVGQAKLARYGDRFLAVIGAYAEQARREP